MKGSLSIILVLLWSISALKGQDLSEEYLSQWKQFYPTKAVQAGIHPAIFQYEDRSVSAIDRWVVFNQQVLAVVSDKEAAYTKHNAIDARLLRVQAQSEIDKWSKLRDFEHDLASYLKLLTGAIQPIIGADYLTVPEKNRLICSRLQSITKLVDAAQSNLTQINQQQLDDSAGKLEKLVDELESLREMLTEADISIGCEDQRVSTLEAVRAFSHFVNQELSISTETDSKILGREEYARQLALYTDSELTPEILAEMALTEIQTVRGLMEEVATSYLQKAYPNSVIPTSFKERLDLALKDMGKDVPLNSRDYEQFWNELADKAIAFVNEEGLGTLPENQTLSIRSAPESAGPAARIGWVGSAPAFDPNPWTTLYLPSIPETLPEQEQKDFWASFNKPFNRIIVIHELFPGHYMQLKKSRETAHPIRLLFPYGIYIEGWATFCERVALDEGWEADDDMTMLAHLRKRIENANRAYTSVQVHTQGWTQDQVMKFSTENSLVAPQFAKSLWYRLMRSPMQLTSYFLGGAQFTELLKSEKERLGDRFDLTLFMDTIMKSGPIPIDEFQGIFAQTIK